MSKGLQLVAKPDQTMWCTHSPLRAPHGHCSQHGPPLPQTLEEPRLMGPTFWCRAGTGGDTADCTEHANPRLAGPDNSLLLPRPPRGLPRTQRPCG